MSHFNNSFIQFNNRISSIQRAVSDGNITKMWKESKEKFGQNCLLAKCPPCTYWPNVRWPSVRWPNVRWPSVRWPNGRCPNVPDSRVGYLQRDFYFILQKYIRQAKCLSFFLGLILGYYEIRDRNSIFLVNNTAYHYYRWYLDRLSLLLLPVISAWQTITITGDIWTDYYYYYYRWYWDSLLLLLLPVISGQTITITITGDIGTAYYYYYYRWYRDRLLLLLLLKNISLLLLTITISNSLTTLTGMPSMRQKIGGHHGKWKGHDSNCHCVIRGLWFCLRWKLPPGTQCVLGTSLDGGTLTIQDHCNCVCL